MDLRTRTLLIAAIGATLLAPVAHAQSVHALGQAAARLQGPPLSPALPTRASTAAQTAIKMQTPLRNGPLRNGNVSDAVDMPMTPPVKAQGATHARAHSSVATRDTWIRLDADHDGRISVTEAGVDGAFDNHFADMDTNHDGYVSDTEYRVFAKANMNASRGATHAATHSAVVAREVFARLDADADGRISAAEAAADAGFRGMFSAMDGNGDGFVTHAEYRAHAKADMP